MATIFAGIAAVGAAVGASVSTAASVAAAKAAAVSVGSAAVAGAGAAYTYVTASAAAAAAAEATAAAAAAYSVAVGVAGAASAAGFYLLFGQEDRPPQHSPDEVLRRAEEIAMDIAAKAERDREEREEQDRLAKQLADDAKQAEAAIKQAEAAKEKQALQDRAAESDAKLEAIQATIARLERIAETSRKEAEAARKEAELMTQREKRSAEARQRAEEEVKRKLAEAVMFARKPWQKEEPFDGNLNICVTAPSGFGKSTFMNMILGLKKGNKERAKTSSVKECTKAPGSWVYCPPEMPEIPTNKQINFWDLPGCGTKLFPLATYIALFGIRHFNLVIIIGDNRVREADLLIMEECKKFNVPVIYVRTKADIDLQNELEEMGFDDDELRPWTRRDKVGDSWSSRQQPPELRAAIENYIATIRAAKKAELPNYECFVISAKEGFSERSVFDLEELRLSIIKNLVVSCFGAQSEALMTQAKARLAEAKLALPQAASKPAEQLEMIPEGTALFSDDDSKLEMIPEDESVDSVDLDDSNDDSNDDSDDDYDDSDDSEAAFWMAYCSDEDSDDDEGVNFDDSDDSDDSEAAFWMEYCPDDDSDDGEDIPAVDDEPVQRKMPARLLTEIQVQALIKPVQTPSTSSFSEDDDELIQHKATMKQILHRRAKSRHLEALAEGGLDVQAFSEDDVAKFEALWQKHEKVDTLSEGSDGKSAASSDDVTRVSKESASESADIDQVEISYAAPTEDAAGRLPH